MPHRLEAMSGDRKMGKKRNSKVIAAEISATRENLTNTVSDLNRYVKPMNLVTRGMGLGSSFFVTEKGNLKVERIIAAAAAGLGLIGIFSRSRKD
jgi:hypothetical protein